jgi:hypothetical protein
MFKNQTAVDENVNDVVFTTSPSRLFQKHHRAMFHLEKKKTQSN